MSYITHKHALITALLATACAADERQDKRQGNHEEIPVGVELQEWGECSERSVCGNVDLQVTSLKVVQLDPTTAGVKIGFNKLATVQSYMNFLSDNKLSMVVQSFPGQGVVDFTDDEADPYQFSAELLHTVDENGQVEFLHDSGEMVAKLPATHLSYAGKVRIKAKIGTLTIKGSAGFVPHDYNGDGGVSMFDFNKFREWIGPRSFFHIQNEWMSFSSAIKSPQNYVADIEDQQCCQLDIGPSILANQVHHTTSSNGTILFQFKVQDHVGIRFGHKLEFYSDGVCQGNYMGGSFNTSASRTLRFSERNTCEVTADDIVVGPRSIKAIRYYRDATGEIECATTCQTIQVSGCPTPQSTSSGGVSSPTSVAPNMIGD